DRQSAAKTSGNAAEAARNEQHLAAVSAWARVLAFHPEFKQRRRQFASFALPEKLDFDNLVAREFNYPELPTLFEGPPEGRRHRDGFRLTDERMTPREALREMHYCIICHPRDKDSCSKGFREKEGTYKKNPLGIDLTGCPLNEKISEAHLLKREGHGIG